MGNPVLVTSRSVGSSEVNAAGANSAAVDADVTNQGAVKALLAQTVKRLAWLDPLVNNAGIGALQPPLATCHAHA